MKKILLASFTLMSMYSYSQVSDECKEDYKEGYRDGLACVEGLVNYCKVNTPINTKCFSEKADGYIAGRAKAKNTEYQKYLYKLSSTWGKWNKKLTTEPGTTGGI